MKYCERIFFSVAVASVVVSGAPLACSSTPRVGETHAGGTESVSNGGGGSSGTASGGAAGQSSTPVGPVFVLPDAAATSTEEVASDEPAPPASGDANCGATQGKLEKKPADLLLVLDRSTSMTQAMDSSQNCATGAATCAQRWATIIASLSKILTASPSDLNWGLKFFSSPTTTGGGAGSSCYVSTGVEVPVGPGNASKIQSQISSVGNASSTPTRAAVDASIAYLKTVNDGNNKYILLATDGEPNCASDSPTGGTMGGAGADDLPATVKAVQNAVAAGYKVFVIGVGPDATNLTSLAQAGGTDKFYSALTPDELSSALAAIVGTVVAGCTYDLPTEPVAPNAVGVFVDKALIPQSDSDGWSYAPGSSTTINIHGSWCDDLTKGRKTLVEIFLPCKPTDVIPTVIP